MRQRKEFKELVGQAQGGPILRLLFDLSKLDDLRFYYFWCLYCWYYIILPIYYLYTYSLDCIVSRDTRLYVIFGLDWKQSSKIGIMKWVDLPKQSLLWLVLLIIQTLNTLSVFSPSKFECFFNFFSLRKKFYCHYWFYCSTIIVWPLSLNTILLIFLRWLDWRGSVASNVLFDTANSFKFWP